MGTESNLEFIGGLIVGVVLYVGVNGMWLILKGLFGNDNT